MQYLLLFYCNNGCTTAPHCYGYVNCLACSWKTCTFGGMTVYAPKFVRNSVGFYDCPMKLYVTWRSPTLLGENGKVRFISTGFISSVLIRAWQGKLQSRGTTDHNIPLTVWVLKPCWTVYETSSQIKLTTVNTARQNSFVGMVVHSD
jgi:hypothetical protein